jgi:hypothetical protein
MKCSVDPPLPGAFPFSGSRISRWFAGLLNRSDNFTGENMKEPNLSSRVSLPWFCGFMAAFGLAATAPIQAQITSQTITSPDEASLRAAANSGGVINLAFDGTLYLANTITLERDITLDGSGHSITISGNNAVRLFKVAPGVRARFINLTLADGWYIGTNGINKPVLDGEPAYGGAIYNQGGTVDLLSCVLSNNAALGGNGSRNSTNAGVAQGGAVYNLAGALNVTNSSFLSNSVTGGHVDWMSPYWNLAGDGWGGAVYNQEGQVHLDQAQFAFNSATGGGGMLVPDYAAASGYGGALHSSGGSVTVRLSTFASNKATSLGGRGTPSGSGGALCLIDALLTCTESQFLGNVAQGANGGHYGSGEGLGGALFSLGEVNLSRCLFHSNSAIGPFNMGQDQAHGNGKGGAIYALGPLSVTACTFVENLAQGGAGGALYMKPFDGGLGLGGGIYNAFMLHLTDSTFVRNVARGGNSGQGAGGNGNGGAGLGGGLYQAGSADLVNVTMATNLAAGGNIDYSSFDPRPQAGPGLGGAFYQEAGDGHLLNVTLAGNSAAGGTGPGIPAGAGVGGAIYSTNGTIWLGNTIVANSVSGGNAFGPLLDGGHNLSSDNTCAFTNSGSLNNTDPKLGPLADNGGLTLTLALLAGSPAIDAGDDTLAPAYDQRGVRRPQGAHADLGAFECIERAWLSPLTRGANNGWQLRFTGRSNGVYSILRASSLNGPWTPCGTATATNGKGEFLDPEPPAGSAFYRLEER